MNSNPLNLDWSTKPLTALFNGNLSQEIFNNNSSCVTPVTFHLPEAMQHNFVLRPISIPLNTVNPQQYENHRQLT